MKKIWSVLLLAVSSCCHAQSPGEKKTTKYFQNYSFEKVIKNYAEVKNPDTEQLRKLAKSYYYCNNFDKAKETYSRFISSREATVADYYNFVLILRTKGEYTEIKQWMQKIRDKNKDDLRAKSFFETEDAFAGLLIPDTLHKIENLSFNSDEDDFAPAYYKDKIVFTTTRAAISPVKRKYNWNNKPFLNIYTACIDSAGELLKPERWNKKINRKWHEGPVSFALNDSIAAYTRNNYSDDVADKDIRLQVYFRYHTDNQWSEIIPFNLNSPDYSVCHPALSQNGNTMFFSSDMPGGYGGMDIYMVKKTADGEWGNPVNLGNKINTEANEIFSFYEEKSGKLYFASNGLNGLGGLDIFVAENHDDSFTSPYNPGVPLNSPFDDFALIINPKTSTGYFSSNRQGGKGGDDIYRFSRYLDVDFPENDKEQPVTDVISGETFSLNYENTTQETENIENEITENEVTDNDIENSNIDHNADFTPQEGDRIILHEIYYDYNKWNILPKSANELDKVVNFLEKNPGISIELHSHTDCRGRDSYNLELSEKRAKSAMNYIISKGITARRIKYKGYGETLPVNNCKDGVHCPEKEHRKNRRTEFIVVDR